MMISRRGLITGSVLFVAAPTIVRASSLMPISATNLVITPTMIEEELLRYWKTAAVAANDRLRQRGWSPVTSQWILTADAKKLVAVELSWAPT